VGKLESAKKKTTMSNKMNNSTTNKKSQIMPRHRRASYLVSYVLFLILNSQFFILNSCEANDPPPPGNGNEKPEPKITLSVDDTSPTEVWLNLVTENIPLPDTLLLIRNNNMVKTIELFDSSYVIYEDSLQPSTTYTYQVTPKGTGSNQQPIISNEVTAVTMDTTSHNFSWEVFEFGEHGNSILRDVAIIDENNIWAVGAIYLKDSTGANDPKLYNAVHWDGNQWEVKRVTVDYKGNPITIDMEGVFAFGATDIWMVGSLPIYGDGENWEIYDVRDITNSDLSLSKAWGTSSNNIYFVGRAGSIAHYNGSSWKKIESGTEVDLRDVWGDDHGNVWITAWEDFQPTQLLRLKDNQAEIVFENTTPGTIPYPDKLSGRLNGIWTKNKNKQIILSTYGVYEILNGNLESVRLSYKLDFNLYGIAKQIRGSELNNILLGGNNSNLWYYNGKSWKYMGEIDGEERYNYSIDVKENISALVGEKYENTFYYKAYLIILRR
jgi:hypothetical protein